MIDPVTFDDTIQHEVEHLYQQVKKSNERVMAVAKALNEDINVILERLIEEGNKLSEYQPLVIQD